MNIWGQLCIGGLGVLVAAVVMLLYFVIWLDEEVAAWDEWQK